MFSVTMHRGLFPDKKKSRVDFVRDQMAYDQRTLKMNIHDYGICSIHYRDVVHQDAALKNNPEIDVPDVSWLGSSLEFELRSMGEGVRVPPKNNESKHESLPTTLKICPSALVRGTELSSVRRNARHGQRQENCS